MSTRQRDLRPPRTYSARQIGGLLVALLGATIIGSGLLINPWVGRLWQGASVVDKLDVLALYFWWSLILGAVTLMLGIALGRRSNAIVDRLTFPVLWIVFLLLFDRFLLVQLGRTLWAYDPELHYRHRPGAVRSLKGMGHPGDLIRINQWGHHDSEFPEEKPAGEFRGVLLGDSVTMGYGLTYGQTFAAHLERLLAAGDHRFDSHQIINTGVHGYATFQETVELERSWRFEPDLIAIGFCLNDVTEPFIVNEEFGGVGFDYHGVVQSPNPVWGYLMNETGFGRLAQRVARRGKRLEAEKRAELYDVRRMAENTFRDEGVMQAWGYVTDELERIYASAKERDVPVVLLVFPFTFQLESDAPRKPQQLLTDHARAHGVDVIDFTEIFARLTSEDVEIAVALERKGYPPDEIRRFFEWKVDKYFFDQDHFTEDGHRVIAESLFEHLVDKGLVGPDGK